MEMYQNIQSHQRLRKRAFPVDESLTAPCQAFVNHSQPTYKATCEVELLILLN